MLDDEVARYILVALSKIGGVGYTHDQAVSVMEDIAKGDTIADLWRVEDVQEAYDMEHGYPEDTPDYQELPVKIKQAALAYVQDHMDASTGINWDVLQNAIEEVE